MAFSNKTTLYRCINSGKPYHGFVCKWGSSENDSLVEKSTKVSVYNIDTGETNIYSSIRNAALSFHP